MEGLENLVSYESDADTVILARSDDEAGVACTSTLDEESASSGDEDETCNSDVEICATSSQSSQSSSSGSNTKRKSYTIRFKNNALEVLNKNGGNVSLTARTLKVNRRQLQKWRNHGKLTDSANSTDGAGERRYQRRSVKLRARYASMEKLLMEWILTQRSEKNGVNMFQVIDQAKILSRDSNFKASAGWFRRFLVRNNLRTRRVTSVGQKVPENAHDIAQNWLNAVQQRVNGLPSSLVFNMDETPAYFDLPSTSTIDFKGVRNVHVKTTGHEKLRYTVVLTQAADGSKLPPMVIFKLKNVPKESFPPGIVVAASPGGSMTTQLMLDIYIPKVLKQRPHDIFASGSKGVIFWDSHLSHKDPDVLTKCEAMAALKPVVIPGGMTSLLQPLDVGVNKTYKANLRDKWRRWISEGEVYLTRTGKRKRASYALVALWALQAWEELDAAVIARSFLTCGAYGYNGDTTGLHLPLQQVVAGQGLVPIVDVIQIDDEDAEEDAEEDSAYYDTNEASISNV